jgi:hypothetical protein
MADEEPRVRALTRLVVVRKSNALGSYVFGNALALHVRSFPAASS